MLDLAWFERAQMAALTPDGNTLLFSDRGDDTGANPVKLHTYMRRTDGSPAVRLGDGYAVSISPDGKWAIAALPGAPPRWQLLPTGPGEPRPLPMGDLECAYASWFPDGKRLLVAGNEPERPFRLYVQDPEGRERRAITPEGLGGFFGEVSPDGKLVVARDRHGKNLLFPLEGGAPRPVPGFGPREIAAGWGADGQSLYVYDVHGDLPLRVDKIDLRSGRRELFKDLSPPDRQAFAGIRRVLVAPGGKAYAYQYGQHLCILYVVEGLR